MSSQPELLDQLGDVLRLRHYSYKTEKSYIHFSAWVLLKFIPVWGLKLPKNVQRISVITNIAMAKFTFEKANPPENAGCSKEGSREAGDAIRTRDRLHGKQLLYH